MNALSVWAERLSKQRHMAAVQHALTLCMPIVVVGTMALIIQQFPLPAYQAAMLRWLGSHWQMLFGQIYHVTLGVLSIFVNFITAMELSGTLSGLNGDEVKNPGPITSAMASLACFLLIMYPADVRTGLFWLGEAGLFPALLVALLATECLHALYRLKSLRTGVVVPSSATTMQAVHAVLPVIVTVTIAVLVKMLLRAAGAGAAILQITSRINGMGEDCTSLGWQLLGTFLSSLLWFLGMGGALGGEGTPNQAFFVTMGGAGAVLCFLIALLVYRIMQKGRGRGMLHLPLLPTLLNIHAPILYGAPLVFNVPYLLPFVFTPVLLTLTTYAAKAWGILPPIQTAVVWTMPAPLGALLATGSWRGAAVALFNLVLGTALYYPFVHFAQHSREQGIHRAMQALMQEMTSTRQLDKPRFLKRSGDEGVLARTLAQDLLIALKKQQLYLVYQPQMLFDHTPVGVEALLRWNHPRFGPVPPPAIITLAEEMGLIHELGEWIIQKACLQRAQWMELVGESLTMSVNISVAQLENKDFAKRVLGIVQHSGIRPGMLQLEITETMALVRTEQSERLINELRGNGVRIAMDDFGMGHGSLGYIKNFPIDTLKIDGSLIHDIMVDQSSREIIAMITKLCRKLGIAVVVEYVETAQQVEVLKRLGCSIYQGYWFGRPMDAGQIVDMPWGPPKGEGNGR